MLENRNLKKDLFAIGLLAGVVFLAISLVTYDPADPIEAPIAPFHLLYAPDQVAYPANDSIHNLCGYAGAMIADALLTGLGVGAYFLVFSLAWVDVTLLRRQSLETPWLRSAGWILTLIGLTSALSLAVPSISLGPVVGPGGYLGALTSGLLRTQFATIGAVIISLSVLMGGLLLYTDYAVLRFARWAVIACVISWIATSDKVTQLRTRRAGEGEEEGELEEDDEAAEEEQDAEPAIRILGRKAAPKREEAELEEEFEDEEEEDDEELVDEEELEEEADEDEEEEIVVKAKSKQPASSPSSVHQPPHFKVRKPEKSERERVMSELNEASRGDLAQDYELPPMELLRDTEDFSFNEQEKEVRIKAKILEKTFGEFGFKVKVVEIETGPVIAQYEIQLEAGLRLSKITGLADDLAIALRVPSVRIVAPIPGKNTVGIEVPNEVRQVVRLREVMELSDAKTRKMKVPLFLGKDVSGNPLTADLASLPHLLIAGRTGTGKSVCLNAIISSILMTRRPDEVRMLMIDPKMVELSGYARLPHLMHPVVTDMRKAEAILAWAVDKMEERYSLLARAGVRHITSYNQLGEEELIRRLEPEDDDERANIPLHLPFIVIVADEIADMMMTAGKEVEQHIIRLAQKSRAVGIHLILATQKPTVDVITGLIKSNLPARISFQVASRTDSRVVLDEMGADRLLGNGDMLFLWPGTSMLLRGQGTYLDDDEIDAITAEVSTGEQHFVNELVNLKVSDGNEDGEDRFSELKKRDELYESAVDVVVREGRGSVSLLQRSLGIGYGRAARLIDFMAEDNIVGPYAGSQAREVLVSLDEWEAMQGFSAEEQSAPAPPRSNRIVPESDVSLEFDEDEEEELTEDDEGESSELLHSIVRTDSGKPPGPKTRGTMSPDDDGSEPLHPPHFNDGGGSARKRRARRRNAKATTSALSQSTTAPWESETESDWTLYENDSEDADVISVSTSVPARSQRVNRFDSTLLGDAEDQDVIEDDEAESDSLLSFQAHKGKLANVNRPSLGTLATDDPIDDVLDADEDEEYEEGDDDCEAAYEDAYDEHDADEDDAEEYDTEDDDVGDEVEACDEDEYEEEDDEDVDEDAEYEDETEPAFAEGEEYEDESEEDEEDESELDESELDEDEEYEEDEAYAEAEDGEYEYDEESEDADEEVDEDEDEYEYVEVEEDEK